MVGLLDHAMVMGIASPFATSHCLRDPDKVESQANGKRTRFGEPPSSCLRFEEEIRKKQKDFTLPNKK